MIRRLINGILYKGNHSTKSEFKFSFIKTKKAALEPCMKIKII